jgi:thiamine-phosphate pyrophosphorylase
MSLYSTLLVVDSNMYLKPELPSGIYGITSRDFGTSHEQSALSLLKAGVRIIQYREKGAPTRAMLNEAAGIKQLCRRYNALFIVNDRLDIALAVDADGVHVGQDDMPVGIVRKYLGDKIVGVSVRDEEETRAAQADGADYLGAGAVFPTSTKQDSTFIGLDMLRKIARISKVPVYAIGGITLHNLNELKRHNILGAAVISAILNTPDQENTAREFIRIWTSKE